MLSGEFFGFGMVGVENCGCGYTGDEFSFRDETVCDTSGADYSEADVFLVGLSELCGRNSFGSREIYDLAEFFEVVELSLPVGADCEDVDVVFLDVVDFLSEVVFDDNFVGVSGLTDSFDAFEDVVADV